MEAVGSSDEGAGAGGSGEAGRGRVGTTGESMGGGGGVRGRFPGPDLAAGILGAGVLGSEFGTTLLMTLERKRETINKNNNKTLVAFLEHTLTSLCCTVLVLME